MDSVFFFFKESLFEFPDWEIVLIVSALSPGPSEPVGSNPLIFYFVIILNKFECFSQLEMESKKNSKQKWQNSKEYKTVFLTQIAVHQSHITVSTQETCAYYYSLGPLIVH